MTTADPEGDAFERALASTEPSVGEELRELVRDASYIDPRVVSHLRD